MTDKRVKWMLIIGGVVVGIGVTGFLTYRYWAPWGKKVTTSLKLPGAKVVTNIDTTNKSGSGFTLPSQIITTQIARFPLDIKAEAIESIQAKIAFKKGPREIKLGVKGDEKGTYTYAPFYHALVQEVSGWEQTKGISNVLYQRSKQHTSLTSLIMNPPAKEKLGAYFVNTDTLTRNLMTTTNSNVVVNYFLRGSHTFYIWVDTAPLVVTISKQDINMYEGEDTLKMAVYKGETKLTEKGIADDGMTNKSLLKKEAQTESMSMTDIAPGIYRLDLMSEGKGSDLVITKIEVNQKRMITKNVFILDNKPSTVYTDDANLVTQIAHAEYVAPIFINDTFEVVIPEAGKKVTTNLAELTSIKNTGIDLYKITSQKNDIAYAGGGYFTFAPEYYFNPEILKTTDLTTVARLEDLDYILTTLTPARQEGDWLVAELTIDPQKLTILGNKLYFSLESPELTRYGGELEIRSFEVEINYVGAMKKSRTEPGVKTSSPKRTPIGVWLRDFFNRFWPKKQITKLSPIPSKGGTVIGKPVATVTTGALNPVPSPSPTISTTAESPKIVIYNSGAVAGAAAHYADLLKQAGYTNVSYESGKETIRDCSIIYPGKYLNVVEAVDDIFKADYSIMRKSMDDTRDQIQIMVGTVSK